METNGEVSADSREQNGSETKDAGGYKLKFCTVCASNQNR